MAAKQMPVSKRGKSAAKSRDSPRIFSLRGFRVHVNGWLELLCESIRAVPVNRFALGVIGIASAAAVALSLFDNVRIALSTTFLMFLMMIVLLLFSWLSKLGSVLYKPLAVAFGWLLLTILGGLFILLLLASAFGWPEHLRKLIFTR